MGLLGKRRAGVQLRDANPLVRLRDWKMQTLAGARCHLSRRKKGFVIRARVKWMLNASDLLHCWGTFKKATSVGF